MDQWSNEVNQWVIGATSSWSESVKHWSNEAMKQWTKSMYHWTDEAMNQWSEPTTHQRKEWMPWINGWLKQGSNESIRVSQWLIETKNQWTEPMTNRAYDPLKQWQHGSMERSSEPLKLLTTDRESCLLQHFDYLPCVFRSCFGLNKIITTCFCSRVLFVVICVFLLFFVFANNTTHNHNTYP